MHVNVFNLVVVLRSQATHCLPIWLGMVLCNGVTVVLPWGFSPFLNSIHPQKKNMPLSYTRKIPVNMCFHTHCFYLFSTYQASSAYRI